VDNNYIKLNKYVSGLKKLCMDGDLHLDLNPFSVIRLLKFKIIILIRGLAKYVIELSYLRGKIFEVIKLKNTKKNTFVAVLAGGPSLDLLSKNDLKSFLENGNELIVSSYWNENKKFKGIVPTYLILADPVTLQKKYKWLKSKDIEKKNISLLKYINQNPKMKIVIPPGYPEWEKKVRKNKIYNTISAGLPSITSNISPLFPQGYIAQSAMKALAFAFWVGYKNIFILGMDNTYSRDIFCDEKNNLLNLENHATNTDYVSIQTERYRSIGDLLQEISYIFYSLELFKKENKIINLDPYSLTNQFPKKSILKNKLSRIASNMNKKIN